jgi:hypothetical protein
LLAADLAEDGRAARCGRLGGDVGRLAATAVLLAMGLAIGLVVVLDRAEASVEARVRRYSLAITSQDAEAALAEISPLERTRYVGFVDQQLGNIYEVRGIAVRSPSLFDRLVRRAPPGPTDVTVVLDINRDYPDDFYTPTTRIPVEQVDGSWYLARPLLAND